MFISVAHLQGETLNVNFFLACVVVLVYVNLEWFSSSLLVFA